MEGGFDPDRLLEENPPTFKKASEVLNFAMMLEAQGMDLYMRYAEKSQAPGNRGKQKNQQQANQHNARDDTLFEHVVIRPRRNAY